MQQKKVLITGGGGFLGSHLAENLLKQNEKVFVLDNFYTGNKQNLKRIIAHPNFSLIEQNIFDSIDLDVDEIFNLACPASPIHYQKDPVFTIKTSVFGMNNMLELARKKKAKIFQASTSEVYGDPHIHPQEETYWGNVNPIGTRSCYDVGKRCAETLCFDFHRMYQLPVKVGRIFNTYGPRMDANDGRVVSNFIVAALKNRPLTIYGNGRQTRSFCYVDDLMEAIMLFMKADNSLVGPINLGNPDEFTILELAYLVLELTGSKSPLKFYDLPSDDPKQRKPNIAKAEKALGWRPKTPLKEGLIKTIDYFDRFFLNQNG